MSSVHVAGCEAEMGRGPSHGVLAVVLCRLHVVDRPLRAALVPKGSVPASFQRLPFRSCWVLLVRHAARAGGGPSSSLLPALTAWLVCRVSGLGLVIARGGGGAYSQKKAR